MCASKKCPPRPMAYYVLCTVLAKCQINCSVCVPRRYARVEALEAVVLIRTATYCLSSFFCEGGGGKENPCLLLFIAEIGLSAFSAEQQQSKVVRSLGISSVLHTNTQNRTPFACLLQLYRAVLATYTPCIALLSFSSPVYEEQICTCHLLRVVLLLLLPSLWTICPRRTQKCQLFIPQSFIRGLPSPYGLHICLHLVWKQQHKGGTLFLLGISLPLPSSPKFDPHL